MPKVAFSPKSRQDLLDIGDYIAKDSRANARRFVGKLMEQCQRIGTSPMGYYGQTKPGLNLQQIRKLLIPLPSPRMQQAFVGRFDSPRSIQVQQSVATANAQAAFDALLANAFGRAH